MAPCSPPDLGTIAVFYLARGADQNALAKFDSFKASYKRWRPGLDHRLYVIYKGFANAAALKPALDVFKDVDHSVISMNDAGFDLGAYFSAASRVTEEFVCFFNTSSELNGQDWLLKLAVNLSRPNVGMVSCSGSYECPVQPGMNGLEYPNPHLRSNGLMMRRDRFIALMPVSSLMEKHDAHLFEHGPLGMSRRIVGQGLELLVVGRNGRGYKPAWWVRSQTFRQGTQNNMLVTDNQTKQYLYAPHPMKRYLFKLAWGDGSVGQVPRHVQPEGVTEASQ